MPNSEGMSDLAAGVLYYLTHEVIYIPYLFCAISLRRNICIAMKFAVVIV